MPLKTTELSHYGPSGATLRVTEEVADFALDWSAKNARAANIWPLKAAALKISRS
jgi:hypothetical protein